MSDTDPLPVLTPYFADHSRSWRENLYVYPVISRRSGGLSIGVNLNPDKACNFDCVYCQVDRTTPPTVRTVDPERLRSELEATIGAVVNGELFADPYFAKVPLSHRRLNDVAFSGDGEPTTSPHFVTAVGIAADVRRKFGLDAMKLVLITDAAYLDRPRVQEGLAILDANNGEIWAKLDAGTEAYYRMVNRPNVPLQKILDNLLAAARVRPIVIQSIWMNVNGQPPPESEIEAYSGHLRRIVESGGRIKLVQIYTIVRRTAESFVTPLDDAALEAIARRVSAATGLPTAIFGAK